MDIFVKRERHGYMIKKLRMDIAYQVKLLRAQRGLTQKDLADKVGTEQAVISQLENWNRPFPTVKTLKTIASALDVALIVRFDNWDEVVGSLVERYDSQNRDREGA